MRRIHWRVIAMIGVVALALIGAGAPALADPLPLPPVDLPAPLGGDGASAPAPAPALAPAPGAPADAPSSPVNVAPKVQVGACGMGSVFSVRARRPSRARGRART